MRIFNEEKTQILENVDLTLGFLKPDTITISEEQQEESHYEEKHYDNGGVAKYKVIDKPYKEAELEQIEVYVLYTEEELKQNKLNELTNWFNTTYRYKDEKYNRLIVMQKPDDDGISPEIKRKELYEEAENVRLEIQRLEEELKNGNE